MPRSSCGFLKKIAKLVANHLDVHVVWDNHRTHKTKEVESWLKHHKRFKLPFTPTPRPGSALGDPGLNARLQIDNVLQDAAPDRLSGDLGEQALDEAQQEAQALPLDRQGRYHPRTHTPAKLCSFNWKVRMNESEH